MSRATMQVGEHYPTNSSGVLEVIEYSDSSKVTVRFTTTGYVTITSASHIRRGEVLDRMAPRICGVGYCGKGPHKVTTKNPVYNRWQCMLYRCYDPRQHARHPSYKDCTVCEEWLNFQNFADWCALTYPQDGEKYELDKDKASEGVKIYSPATCLWISRLDNMQEAMAFKMKDRVMLAPSGEAHKFRSIRQFAKEQGLDSSSLAKVLRGVLPHYKGWTKGE